MVEFVAPAVGGVTVSDGSLIEGDEKVGGGPSVLYDAVALVVSGEGAQSLVGEPAARDFVADAFAHGKFIAYTREAMPLLEKAGIVGELDEGCVELGKDDAKDFVAMLSKLRHWARMSG